MIPRSKLEDIAGAMRKISDWFQERASDASEDADHWGHVIRALAVTEAANEIERLKKYRDMVLYIAGDSVELSWEKIEIQRDLYQERCRKLRDDLEK